MWMMLTGNNLPSHATMCGGGFGRATITGSKVTSHTVAIKIQFIICFDRYVVVESPFNTAKKKILHLTFVKMDDVLFLMLQLL